MIFIFLLYTLPTLIILFFQSGHAVENIITPRIAKAGAKSETEITTISTNFSFVSCDTDEGIFNVLLLDLGFCLEFPIFF